MNHFNKNFHTPEWAFGFVSALRDEYSKIGKYHLSHHIAKFGRYPGQKDQYDKFVKSETFTLSDAEKLIYEISKPSKFGAGKAKNKTNGKLKASFIAKNERLHKAMEELYSDRRLNKEKPLAFYINKYTLWRIPQRYYLPLLALTSAPSYKQCEKVAINLRKKEAEYDKSRRERKKNATDNIVSVETETDKLIEKNKLILFVDRMIRSYKGKKALFESKIEELEKKKTETIEECDAEIIKYKQFINVLDEWIESQNQLRPLP